jgi:hypothetical protein
MPMVYRVSPRMVAEAEERRNPKRKGPRGVPLTGAGQGGSLVAFTSASAGTGYGGGQG